ncbi:RNA-binding protein [Ruminococcus albus]|uniref:S4 domain protein n=1 Tax=Ruminococcus albus 8 TaxID=246199 RepID=E9SEN0_RUMAL|nr:YlmH/Sll1252 family protein [Ruminococcus albus]EGC02259.1 S4 domain protein [Ruminococcus albus 8]MCC3351730.1 YlmH/Sll1252 family protein [Ruminococcus albus 8]
MQRNFSFLTDITDDDKRLLSRFLDWTEMAEEKYITKHSAFLDERQCRLCEKVMASVKYENYLLWGGYEGAERKMLCVYPQYGDEDIKSSFPMTAVTFKYRSEDKLSHRDFLGSLMALGITRDCVGDILVGDGRTSVFVKDTAARDVMSVSKIGRVGVKTEDGFDPSTVIMPEFREITGTVASLRLDSVLSLALRISREKASALIKGGAVEISHVRTEQTSKHVEVGEKISARGYGKFLVKSVDGVSHKDRLHITICKYI